MKKIIVFTLLLLFLAVGFVGCKTNNMVAYKTAGKSEIDAHAASKLQTNFSADNWMTLCKAVISGKATVDRATTKPQVDVAVKDTIDVIDKILEIREMQDFELHIAVNKTSFSMEEEIIISVSLKNKSGKDVEIAYYFLLSPYIPSAINEPATTEMPPEPYTKIFQKDETIYKEYDLGGLFAPEQHEIKYKATFYLNWSESYESKLEIWSNALKITVN